VDAVGLDPDLQEVQRRVLRGVELAVPDAVAGAHPLQFARAEHAFAAVVVAVRQPAFEHVADDLHVGVAVRRGARARRDAILVDHPQRTPAHPRRVVVVAEGKRVAAVEPAGLDVAAFGGSAQDLHGIDLGTRKPGRRAVAGAAAMRTARGYSAASAAGAIASVVKRSFTSWSTLGTYIARSKSLRLIAAVASKPSAARLVIGCAAALLRVTASTTGLVMSLMVRSAVTVSSPSPMTSTLVLLKVAAGNLAMAKTSALHRCLSKSSEKLSSP